MKMIFIFIIVSINTLNIAIGCEDSLNDIISSRNIVSEIADVLINKYKTKEEIIKLKPYSIKSDGRIWILDTNPIWKDPKTGKKIKQGGVHIKISQKTGKILCFNLGK